MKKNVAQLLTPNPDLYGHPLLAALFDSFCIIDGMVCWNHSAMFEIRDKLQELDLRPPLDNSACKFAAGGAKCMGWCGDKVCLKKAD